MTLDEALDALPLIAIVRAMEVPLNSPDPLESIGRLALGLESLPGVATATEAFGLRSEIYTPGLSPEQVAARLADCAAAG